MSARHSNRHVTLHLGSALIAVALLCSIPAISAKWLGERTAYTLLLLAFAAISFVIGFVWKIARWMRAPIPFRIALTTGQHKSLPTLTHEPSRAPHTSLEVLLRVLFDVALFRPLWRATPTAPLCSSKLSGNAGRLLLLFSAAFHASMVVVAMRHLRLLLSPVPQFVTWLQGVDSLSELFVPKVHASSFLLLLAIGGLVGRRLVLARLRYISLAADYFPLVLLGSIATTGVLIRHVTRTDVTAVKATMTHFATLSFGKAQGLDTLVLVHLFLVCGLLVYFPLSKLMHMPGAVMSPTLTLANNSRAQRHVNVNNPNVQVHAYSEYEATFRERMIEAGLPVEEP